MARSNRCFLLGLSVLMCACASRRHDNTSLRRVPSPIVAEIMAQSRRDGNGFVPSAILSNRDSVVDVRIRDELLDSIVAFMMDVDKDADPTGLGMHFRFELADASRGHQTVPYPQISRHLVRLADSARSMIVRSEAIYDIAGLEDQKQAIDLLKRFATSNNPAARAAILMLETLGTQPDGRNLLKSLYERGAVHEPGAKRDIEKAAWRNEWKVRQCSTLANQLSSLAAEADFTFYDLFPCKGDRQELTKAMWKHSSITAFIGAVQVALLRNLSLDILEASAAIAASDPLRERRISAAGLLTQSLISMLAVSSPDSTIGYWRFISRTRANEGTPEMRVRSRALLKELAAQSAHAEIRDIARTALQHDVPIRSPN